jgi:hypothetical protein
MMLSSVILPAAALAKPEIETRLSTQKITLGQSVRLEILAEWPKKEGQYTLGVPNLKLRNLTLENQGQSQENFLQGGEEWVRKTFAFDLKPEKEGEAAIEPLLVAYYNPTTQESGNLSIPEQTIDIKKEFFLAKLPWRWILVFAAALLLIGVPAGFFLASRLKPKVKALQSEHREHPAIEELQALMNQPPSKNQKEIFSDLSLILYKFIESSYGVNAKSVKGQELIQALRSQRVPDKEIVKIKQFFDQLSAAKFAGTPLSEAELMQLEREMIGFFKSKQAVGNP